MRAVPCMNMVNLRTAQARPDMTVHPTRTLGKRKNSCMLMTAEIMFGVAEDQSVERKRRVGCARVRQPNNHFHTWEEVTI